MNPADLPFRMHVGTYVDGEAGEAALRTADMTLPAIFMALCGGRYATTDRGGPLTSKTELVGPDDLPPIQIHTRPESMRDDAPASIAKAILHRHRSVGRPDDVDLRAARIVARAVAEGRLPAGTDGANVVVRCPTPWSLPIIETYAHESGVTNVAYDPVRERMPSIGLLLVPTFETYRDVFGVERRSAWILMAHSSTRLGRTVPDAMEALRVLAAEAADDPPA
jgi:hypothetical protein